MDINACDAWDITTGCSNVILAIVDSGIDNNHNEFIGANFSPSYDSDTDTQPAIVYFEHGTHVAGVIAANHNSLRIAGSAPDTKIMEISNSLQPSMTLSEDLASGINWAVANGADVISNSWGDQGGQVTLQSALLEDAIDNGRGGLGCVVVFSSGNWGSPMDYPGTYRNEILTVGSININGDRSTFNQTQSSGFGSQLDVMAPGTSIFSTILNGGYDSFSGTSQAAPYVSALNSLIIDINPILSVNEIVSIIESTTQKIGPVGYANKIGRPNGTWNSQFGYGLIDMDAALLEVRNSFTTSGSQLLCNNAEETYSITNIPVGGTVTWSTSSNLSIVSGQGTSSIRVKAASIGNGNAWIRATAGACGNVVMNKYNFWIGKPMAPVTNPSGIPAIQASLSSYVTINVTEALGTFGGYNLTWWTNDPTSLDVNPGGTSAVVECLKTGYNYVYVKAANSCGTSLTRQIPIDVPSGGGGGCLLSMATNSDRAKSNS